MPPAQLCLLSRSYQCALPVLQKDVTEVEPHVCWRRRAAPRAPPPRPLAHLVLSAGLSDCGARVRELDAGAGRQLAALDPLDALLYFYYGGMVYIGLKRFEDAFDLLLIVRAPAAATSPVCVRRRTDGGKTRPIGRVRAGRSARPRPSPPQHTS